jgi:hypothetical protein
VKGLRMDLDANPAPSDLTGLNRLGVARMSCASRQRRTRASLRDQHVAPQLHLTRDDLVALTGYQQPRRMCAWLRARGWVYEAPARRGDVPKVARAYHDARMSGATAFDHGYREGPRMDFMLNARQ